ncbi:MAG: glycosyltransferase family 2 protein [Lachnospiraceae bacterium]|nr:glycosyltransferase family 2 protein [Lachnospiraceae bacterium]
MEVTVLIPTYRPDGKLNELLRRLSKQTMLPSRVLLLNTVDGEEDGQLSESVDRFRDCFPVLSVFHVDRKDFDHGGTRHLGMTFADTELVLCMTQDAVPKDRHLISSLAGWFEDPLVAVVYGRQLALRGSMPEERFTRSFNYPDTSRVKSKEDLEQLGIKTFFCSDVCAMWRRETYFEMGGFERRTIFNEDMILAGKMIRAGYRIVYDADAEVWHSHSYSCVKQLKRNFDLGVSQAEHPEVFSMAASTGEGIKMVKQNAAWLLRSGNGLRIPKLIMDSGCKYLGYFLGKRYRKLPKRLILKLTDNRMYWE